jgi:hypothetical protein
MSGDALASAFEALITGVTVYKGTIPDNPSFPYVYVVTNFPTVAERALTRDAQSRLLRSRTTVGGESASSVRIVAQKLSDLMEGARPVVAGWTLGRVESEPNDQPIQVDLDVTIPNIGHPLYQVFDWKLTGSKA